MSLRAIDELPPRDLEGRCVLVRVAGDEGLSACGRTLQFLAEAGARTILAADGSGDAAASLAGQVRRTLGLDVRVVDGGPGGDLVRPALAGGNSEVLLLPGIDAHPGEHRNDPDFARRLASVADVYCNEAFALAHLGRASTVGIVRFIETAFAGFEMTRQIAAIEAAVEHAAAPSLAIVGGTGLDRKAALLIRLCGLVDRVFLGGTLCLPFLKAKGVAIAAAAADDDLVPVAKEIMDYASGRAEILLPCDFMTVDRKSKAPDMIESGELRDFRIPMDIGSETIRRLTGSVATARRLFWCGPLGVWEMEPFAAGTRQITHVVAARAAEGLSGVLWGESLARALQEFEGESVPLHAMVAPSAPATRLISGLPLPAVEALRMSPEIQPRKIVVPIDGSAAALELLRRTGPLFEESDSEIHLVFVASARESGGPGQVRPDAERAFAQSDAALANFLTKAAAHVVRHGELAECVLEYASEIRADVIAVPCRDVPAPARWLAGDWPRAIERRATVPLMLVRVNEE